MTLRISGKTYYRTSEACRKAGLSKATLFRWLKAGTIQDVEIKDRNGRRLFTSSDIKRIKAEVTKVSKNVN